MLCRPISIASTAIDESDALGNFTSVLRNQVDATSDFIGRRSLTRPTNLRDDRLQLVGLDPVDGIAGQGFLPIGAHLCSAGSTRASDGYVTSSGFSPTMNRAVALAMVHAGERRIGEILTALAPAGRIRVRIAKFDAFDPSGERLDG